MKTVNYNGVKFQYDSLTKEFVSDLSCYLVSLFNGSKEVAKIYVEQDEINLV